jgi:PHD-finger
LDTCVLCGLGGNLLCCDGCPAAYHMRCIGEGAKSIPDGEWLCTECSLGGRGEHPSQLFCCQLHVTSSLLAMHCWLQRKSYRRYPLAS